MGKGKEDEGLVKLTFADIRGMRCLVCLLPSCYQLAAFHRQHCRREML